MKKNIVLLMLLTSITATAFAQHEFSKVKPDKIFDPEPEQFKRRWLVDLGRGNHLQIEAANLNELEKFKNIDSLLRLFRQDISAFKDSLQDDLFARRIDYIIDSSERKKIRIQHFGPAGSSFLVQRGTRDALKLAQDTVYIIGEVAYKPGFISNEAISHRYYRIGLFLNQLNDLNDLMNTGLNDKMTALLNSRSQKWINDGSNHWHIKNGDKTITAIQSGSSVSETGDMLTIAGGISLQNYKNYFVPSFTISASLKINTPVHTFETGLSWEPQFLFAKNTSGKLETFRNDFINLSFGFENKSERTNTENREPQFNFLQRISIGYLVRNKGDFYEPHTFRLGTSAASFNQGRIKLEPVFYFHDFFKNVTPGLKLSMTF